MSKSKQVSTDPTQDRYRLLIEAVTDYAIYMLDPSGHIVSWNPGAQRLKGYSAEEIIGSHFSTFYTEPDRLDGSPTRGLETAVREERFENEGWRVRKDGTRFWAHVVIDPVRDDEGHLIGFAKITRDLTERKMTEDALRKSEEQLRLLVQGVTDYAIYLLSADGLVANWNLGAQTIKGYAPEEIIGRHFSVFYTEEDRIAGKPERNLAIAAREGRVEEEGWRVRKDGTRFMAHVIIDAIRDETGMVTGFAKVTRDITERREAQAALEQAREELVQAQKMDAVGRLTGGVAHDFNNFLTIVLISLRLARKRLDGPPDVLRLIDNAIHGAERGASLTQRMLAFSRRQSLRVEEVSLATLVAGLTDILQRSIGLKIHIDTQFSMRLPNVMADAHQLETALLNLVLNARDAMPDGGDITIRGRNPRRSEMSIEDGDSDPDQYVILEVMDTGEGMDPATLEKAVEPFFTTKGVGKGTGLGLSMVHGIAEQLGGKLKLRSIERSGTTVQLWLPAAKQGPAAAAGPVSKPARITGLPSLRILAVDDDELVLTNTCALLEELGHRPLRAHSAVQALKMLSQQPVDMVLTDHSMPGMTGTELLEALTPLYPGLPVVIASGYAEITDPVTDDQVVLAKPFDEVSLSAALSRAMAANENPASGPGATKGR